MLLEISFFILFIFLFFFCRMSKLLNSEKDWPSGGNHVNLVKNEREEPLNSSTEHMPQFLLREGNELERERMRGGSQLTIDDDEAVTERDDDVEDDDLLDQASMKDLILRLNRAIAKEEILEWDSVELEEEEIDSDSDEEEYLEHEGGGRY